MAEVGREASETAGLQVRGTGGEQRWAGEGNSEDGPGESPLWPSAWGPHEEGH